MVKSQYVEVIDFLKNKKVADEVIAEMITKCNLGKKVSVKKTLNGVTYKKCMLSDLHFPEADFYSGRGYHKELNKVYTKYRKARKDLLDKKADIMAKMVTGKDKEKLIAVEEFNQIEKDIDQLKVEYKDIYTEAIKPYVETSYEHLTAA